MTGQRIVALALGAAAIGWIGLSAQQEMLSRPGPGSGTMDVRVINHPAVLAAQSGEWRVAVDNVPEVRVANVVSTSVSLPAFAEANRRFVVTWASGESETVTIREPGHDGWVRVDQRRWINLRNARAVEELR